MSIIYDFFTANGYVFEILLSVAFFTWWMNKRPGFFVRGALVFLFLLLSSMAWSFLPFVNVWTRSLQTIVFFSLCVAGVKFCFKVSAGQAAFYVTAAGAAQHFSFKAARTLLAPVWLFAERPETYMNAGYPVLLVLFLLIGMQLCTNVFQNLFDEYSAGYGYQAYTIFSLFDMVCCLFLLSLQYEITRNENERQSNEILKHILFQQKQQMKISKETIDLINVKCHDIKNQISLLGERVSKEEIRELEQAINIYDTALKTGNEALDVLLVEKLMQCGNKNIRFDCMLEGSRMDFMKQSDIYSLFGNAIDNAIEAVDKIIDPERRCISVKAHADKGMLVIHFENFYEGNLTFESGLPATTKRDKRYHGFGMKSIRMITEKYNGYLSVKAKQGIFTLNILLTIPS